MNNQQISNEMSISVFDVVKFFLQKDVDIDGENSISNLKIQKLLYYAQGFHLAIFGTRLFDNDIHAWQHGPVIPEVYHELKSFGNMPITHDFDNSAFDVFTPEQFNFLNQIFNEYDQFSAWKLRNMTHEEAPWLNNFSKNEIIPDIDLINFFGSLVN